MESKEAEELERVAQLFKHHVEIFRTNVYKVPQPVEPKEEDLTWYKLVGPVLIQLGIVGISAFLLSGSRTGSFFYIVEEAALSTYGISIPYLSEAQAALSVLVFEMLVVAEGFFAGSLQLKKMRLQGKTILDVNPPKAASTIAFIVLLFAGIFSVLPLTGVSIKTLDVITAGFAIASIAGVTVILHGTAKFIAIAIEIAPMMRQQIVDEYAAKLAKWESDAESAFTSSQRYYRKELYSVSRIKTEPQKANVTISKTEDANLYITKFVSEKKSIPTADDVAGATTAGRTLANRRINYFIAENGTMLLNLGIMVASKVRSSSEWVARYEAKNE